MQEAAVVKSNPLLVKIAVQLVPVASLKIICGPLLVTPRSVNIKTVLLPVELNTVVLAE